MSDEYKRLIIEKVKSEINKWIDNLKQKHKNLLLTKQWQVLFPKGFNPGHIALPVVTGCKSGKYLVGEIQFVLPDDLDLDIDSIELVLKDEAYDQKSPDHKVALDEQFALLNNLVIGVNDFLQTLTIPLRGGSTQLSMFPSVIPNRITRISPITVVGTETAPNNDVTVLLNSPYLPDWIKTIESRDIRDQLMNKLTAGYTQYQHQYPTSGTIKDYFDKYTNHLLNQGHLHWYCKYKGKAVELDSRKICQESYCSKKPFNSLCPLVSLRFGKE